MVIIHTGGRIGGRASGGNVGERSGSLAIPHLGSIQLGVSTPANGHAGRTGISKALLEWFIRVAGNSARNMHAGGLRET